MQNHTNTILATDSYKSSHWKMYPPEVKNINSYIEARYTSDPDYNHVVFFGLQAAIKKYLLNPITLEDIEEAEEVFGAHGTPFNKEGWMHILHEYDGYFPVVIEALPEGMKVPFGGAMVQVRTYAPNTKWLGSYIETLLLRSVWDPSTVATISGKIKDILVQYALKDGTDLNSLNFKLHDFGARGVSSGESASLGGLANLISFRGTDTVEALMAGRNYYGEHMAGFSIPAMEHSTIISWGREREVDAYRNMIKQYGNEPMYAVVSDSYDIMNAVENIWGGVLREEVLNAAGTLIIRPDSGDPVETPVEVIKKAINKFGAEVNANGYQVLNPKVRVIQGDGINKESIVKILDLMHKNKLAVENIAFGMGGALLQKVDRDTFGFAMKASSVMVEEFSKHYWKDVWKESPGKQSKRGILSFDGNTMETVKRSNIPYDKNLLQMVYADGSLLKDLTFTQIRENAEMRKIFLT